MNTLKFGFEKPLFIWFSILFIYSAVFFAGIKRSQDPNLAGSAHFPFFSESTAVHDTEKNTLEIIHKFSEDSFPPKIGFLRESPDWGHLGFDALFGRLEIAFKGDLNKMRLVCFLFWFAALFMFIKLGFVFTYRNRLNPLWISLSTLLMSLNPYSLHAAFSVNWIGIFLLLIFLAIYFFEKEWLGWAGIFLAIATLVDFRALLMAFCFVLRRMRGESTRLLRPERMLSLLLPFAIGALPLLAWKAIVPFGALRDQWHQFRNASTLFRPEGFFYMIALLPIYTLLFSWNWGIRARERSLLIAAILSVLFIPLYFLFPIGPERFTEIVFSQTELLGYVDHAATLLVGEYKNLLLFLPFLAGIFFYLQLFLMDVLDQSRFLRYFIILFFLIQPFLTNVGDAEFLIVAPIVFLFSLSEALVGDEGKLA